MQPNSILWSFLFFFSLKSGLLFNLKKCPHLGVVWKKVILAMSSPEIWPHRRPLNSPFRRPFTNLCVFVGRRKSLWASQEQHPVLQLFFSATHLHFMLVEFLESVCFDHSVLLDFIVSPEVCEFEEFLADYLETCCADWDALSAACQKWDHLHATCASDYSKPVQGVWIKSGVH